SAASSASASRRPSRPPPPSATPSSTPSASASPTPRTPPNASWLPWPIALVDIHRLAASQRRARTEPPATAWDTARPRRWLAAKQTRGYRHMKNFTYYRPASPEQAVALLENRWGGAELLAGGTDLLDLQKEYIAQPTKVVSLTGINALGTIQVD